MKKIISIKSSLSAVMTFVFMFTVVIGMLAPTTTKAEEATPANDLVIDEVTGEVLSMRDEYTQAFMQEDGQIKVYSYTVPVFYRDANKELVEIDGTLVKSENEKYAYTNKANDVKTYFADNISDEQPVMMTYGNAAITVSPVNAASSKATVLAENTEYKYDTGKGNLFADETVLYKDTYKNADLAVTTSNVGMRQNLILKSADAKNTYMFEIGTKNVTAVNENGMVVFVNRVNEVVFKLCAPTAIDAEGNHCDAAFEIVREDEDANTIIVRMNLDSEYLNNEAVYPVTVRSSVSRTTYATMDFYTYKNKLTEKPTVIDNTDYLLANRLGYDHIYLKFPAVNPTGTVTVADVFLTADTGSVPENYFKLYGITSVWTKASIQMTGHPSRTLLYAIPTVLIYTDIYDFEVHDIVNYQISNGCEYGFCVIYNPPTTIYYGAEFYATEYGVPLLGPYMMYTVSI